MIKRTLIASCLLAGYSAVAAQNNHESVKPYTYEVKVNEVIGADVETATNRYFVQLRSLPTALSGKQALSSDGKLDMQSSVVKQQEQTIQREQDQFLQSLTSKLGQMPKVQYRYHTAFNGFSMELTEAQAEKLVEMPQVLKVIRQREYKLQTDVSPKYTGADTVWSSATGGNDYMGEGVVVGIIDSGINYDHPSFAVTGDDGYTHTNPNGNGIYLGDCLEYGELCNDKLIGVFSYDSVTASYNGVRPENGVDYNGHGSHVASTVAGNILRDLPYYQAGDEAVDSGEAVVGSNIAQMSGMAPHANIVSFQVCSATGGCDPAAMVKAVEDAIEHGVDVINMSIGPSGEGVYPWTNALDMAFLAAHEAGTFVALSAGNSGANPAGNDKADSNVGHLAPWTTVVANASHDRSFEKTLTSSSEAFVAMDGSGGVAEEVTAEVIYADEVSGDFPWQQYADCSFNAVANSQPALNGKIVICDRGGSRSLFRKAELAALNGAVGIIIRNVPDFDSTKLYSIPYPIAGMQVDEANGQTLVDWVAEEKAAGRTPTLTMSPGEAVSKPDNANVINISSSRGPYSNHPNLLVPHITGPGTDVYAAYTDEQPFHDSPAPSDYSFLSGTSMASPHIAGAAAIIKSVHPDWTPAEIQSALMMTANPDTKTFDNAGTTDIWGRGAGMLQVNKAVNAGLVMNIDRAEFMAADPEQGGEVTGLNMAYLLEQNCPGTCTWTRTFRATEDGTWNFQANTSSFYIEAMEAEPATIELSAGETATVTFTATYRTTAPDEWMDASVTAIPMHGGPALTLPTRFKPLKAIIPDTLTSSYAWLEGGVSFDKFRFREPENIKFINAPFVKAQSHELTTTADSNTADVFDDVTDGAAYFTFDVAEASDKPVEFYVSSADNIDTDLFIGLDDNFDNTPQAVERICISGGQGNVGEYCRLEGLVPGSYWVMVWNYEGDMDNPNTIVVDVVEEKTNNLIAVNANPVGTAEPYANWPVELLWDGELEAGANYYGSVDVLSYDPVSQTYAAFGSTDITVKQKGQPVTASVSVDEIRRGDEAQLIFEFAANPFAQQLTFTGEVTLAGGFSLTPGSEFVQNGTTVTFEHTLAAGTGASQLSVPVSVTGLVYGEAEHSYVISQNRNEETVAGSLIQVNPNTPPEISAQTSTDSVKAGDSLNLTAVGNDADGDELSYSWQQVAGVAAQISNSGSAETQVTAPQVEATTTLTFEVSVSDGEFTSTEEVQFMVEPQRKSSGGASTFMLLLLMPIWLMRKRCFLPARD